MNTVSVPFCYACGVPHVPDEVATRVRAGEEVTIEVVYHGSGVAANVAAHGTGALNIEQTRIRTNGENDPTPYPVLASLPSVQDAVPRICAALRSCSTFDIARVRSVLGRGDTLLPAAQGAGSLHSANANGHAHRSTAVQDSLGDCPACRRFGDELTRRVRAAVQEGAPSLADVLADSAEALATLLHSRDCQCTGHPSTADALLRFSSLLNLLDKYTTSGIERQGRWPANVVLDEEAARLLDEQSGERGGHDRAPYQRKAGQQKFSGTVYNGGTPYATAELQNVGHGDTGGPSRFFLNVPADPPIDDPNELRFRYQSKASRAERNAGLDGMPERVVSVWGGDEDDLSEGKKATRPTANHHPTVKPIALMRWLVRLVTPPGGTVLDPFMGSGTTGCAATLEGFAFIGIEAEPDYLAIAERRIAHWAAQREPDADAPRQLSMVAD